MSVKSHKKIRQFPHAAVLIISVVVIYVTGIFLGFGVFWGFSFIRFRADLITLSHERGEHTLTSFAEYETPSYGADYYLFNPDMRLIFVDLGLSEEAMTDFVYRYAEETFQEGDIYKSAILRTDTDGLRGKSFYLIAATQVMAHNGRYYASLAALELPNLLSSINAYVVIFTVMYIIFVSLFARYMHNQKKMNDMQRDFIANVSHELKTPITSIKSSAGIMYDGLETSRDAQHKYSQIILKESDHLEHVVKDILELSKLQSSRADFTKTKVCLDELFEPVIDRYMMLCYDTGRTLHTEDLNTDDLAPLNTNLEQATRLTNVFLENAVKFSGDGGNVFFSIKDSPDYITVCVRDDGPGIDSEGLRHIFDRFYKGDSTHNTKGSGLGLSIAQEIAKGLDEKIWVDSKVGSGTSFYFTLHH